MTLDFVPDWRLTSRSNGQKDELSVNSVRIALIKRHISLGEDPSSSANILAKKEDR
jgi:hypothetical protein